MSNKKYDVIVVGGGPAGSATAICCASAGKEVLLIEKGSRNRYKSCGGVLPLVAPENQFLMKSGLNRLPLDCTMFLPVEEQTAAESRITLYTISSGHRLISGYAI